MIASFPSSTGLNRHGQNDWSKPNGRDVRPAPGLLNAMDLLVEIWPNPSSRPSLRWLREQTAKRLLPYFKIGHKVFFDPTKVRQALEKKFSVLCY